MDTRQNRLDWWRRTFALVNAMIGIWWAILFVYIFIVASGGGVVGEPNKVIVHTELYLSILMAAWFIFQLAFAIWYEMKEGGKGN